MKKQKKQKGVGLGPHHEVSPMGHATRTKTRKGKIRAEDRRRKQQGWAL